MEEGQAIGQLRFKLLPAAGDSTRKFYGDGIEQGIHATSCWGAHGVPHREGRPKVGWAGLLWTGEGQALVLEILICVGEEGASPQRTADAPLWTFQTMPAPRSRPKPVSVSPLSCLMPTSMHREEGGAIGQGDRPCGFQPNPEVGEAAL